MTRHRYKSLCTAIIAAIISVGGIAGAGGNPPFEIDMKDLEKIKAPGGHRATKRAKPTRKPSLPTSTQRSVEAPPHAVDGSFLYTVKPGDNLFKILMHDFGMSNREAELLIPEVVRINGLASGTRLTTGQKIRIPLGSSKALAAHGRAASPDHRQKRTVAPSPTPLPSGEATPGAKSPPLPAPPTEPSPPFSVRSVTGSNPDQLADGVLTALALPWSRDRVIEGTAGKGEGGQFSIKVDRYLELQGKRYVVTGSGQDPFAYTLLRLLEMAGYRVIRLDGKSDFATITPHLLNQLGIAFTAGLHRFIPSSGEEGPRELSGFMATLPHQANRVFLTETPLDAQASELLANCRVEMVPTPAEPAGTPPQP